LAAHARHEIRVCITSRSSSFAKAWFLAADYRVKLNAALMTAKVPEASRFIGSTVATEDITDVALRRTGVGS
jgi:hypothetical protein